MGRAKGSGCINKCLGFRDKREPFDPLFFQHVKKLQGSSCAPRIENDDLMLFKVGGTRLRNGAVGDRGYDNHQDIYTLETFFDVCRSVFDLSETPHFAFQSYSLSLDDSPDSLSSTVVEVNFETVEGQMPCHG